MAILTTAQDGAWNDGSTWVGGTAPTSGDILHIEHTVTVSGACVCNTAIIYEGGGIINDNDTVTASSLTCQAVNYRRTMIPAPFRLDGVTFSKPDGRPLTCIGNISDTTPTDGFPPSVMIGTTNGAIIDDGGIFNASATLQDIKPEGCGRAYTRKVSNAVRYLSVTLRLPRSEANSMIRLRLVYQWAEQPFQIIAINGSCAIKGYVESVVYDQASIGTAYHVLKITIAEGQQ